MIFANVLYPPCPPYWEGRFSNGPVWPEYLAEDLGLSNRFYDYAVGRATTSDVLNGQVIPYTENCISSADFLYVLGSANNDFLQMNPADPTAWIAPAVGNIYQSVMTLYADGARHVLVANVPNYGLTPRVQATGDPVKIAGATAMAETFNGALEGVLAQIESQTDITLYRLDIFALSTDIVMNPDKYGFTNSVDPYLPDQIGNVSEYVFFDDIHPTTAVHALLVPEPATVVMLMAGSCLVLRRRKR